MKPRVGWVDANIENKTAGKLLEKFQEKAGDSKIYQKPQGTKSEPGKLKW